MTAEERRERNRAATARYRARNRDKEKARAAALRRNDSGRAKRYTAKWRDANREQKAAYAQANKGKWKLYGERYRAKYPDRVSERSREFHRKNPEAHRAAHMRRAYGLSLADFDRMRIEQGNECVLCRVEFAASGRAKACVDHDHGTGKVRALLCLHCNTRLGQIEDSVWHAAAVAYLQSHGGPR